ncbi:MAG TPA: hypothetical protein VMX55_14585 [candidate division Zixibacteria bacterium]|nr:hypothetical protein [candidate division Zixibacteria bacterium]
MDIRSISSQNLIPIIDPTTLKQSPDEFLAENGGFLSEVAIVGKSTSGFVHYRSSTAPAHRETSEFFSTFASIADSIGIKVYAYVQGFADEFFAKNKGYSAIKDGGNPNDYFVDPFKAPYTNYLKSIFTEIISYPIQGIILDNIRFPREEYSFCESCRRAFSDQHGIDRIFSLGDIQRDERLLNDWLLMRKNKLDEILNELALTITSKQGLELNIVMDIDPAVEGEKGAYRHYGQDINVIGKYGIPTIHLSAWTPYPNSKSDPEYQLLQKNLKFIKDYKAKTQKVVNLMLWGIESDTSLNLIDDIKSELDFNKIYIQNNFPVDFRKRRETHLGLG